MMTPEQMEPMMMEPAPAPAPTPTTSDTIPLESLAMPDDSEQLVNPEPGDVVTYTVEGKVVSVDGNVAVIERTSVNGRELPAAAQPETEMAGLEQMAGEMDSERI